MGKMIANDKDIVVPGENLAEGMDFLPGFGTYRDGDNIVALMVGQLRISGRALKIVPLSGKYVPKKDDLVIGNVTDITFNGWLMDVNSAYHAMLPMKDATSDFITRGADLTKYFKIGDWVATQITNVTSQKLADATMKGPGLKKLTGGRIIYVSPSKVPRIIGRQGSMVSLLKNTTGCRIVVGQNGVVWVDGDPQKEQLAKDAIRLIEQEAHTQGLTEKIQAFLGGSK
ncbi:MAG: exosome complex protein Rrp4 [Nanoarchaeota archaeon]|nr:exosome complex protein Rrp4 [Nanoarchaeota archaeon]